MARTPTELSGEIAGAIGFSGLRADGHVELSPIVGTAGETRWSRENADPHRSASSFCRDDDEWALREPQTCVRANHGPKHLPDATRFPAHTRAVLDEQLAFVERHARLLVA